MVQVNGDVTTCCLDEPRERHREPQSNPHPRRAVERRDHDRWREAQIAGRFEDSGPLCPRCNWESAGAYPEDKVAAWVAKFKANR